MRRMTMPVAQSTGRLDDLFTRILTRNQATDEVAPADLWEKIRHVDKFYFDPEMEIAGGTQLAEKIRELRTNILTLKASKGTKSILLSSCHHGEGKSSASINLAKYMSKNEEYRTLLVDCDLRRPSVKKFLNWEVECGLDDVLNGKASLDEAILYSEQDNLSVLFTRCGHLNGAEMLERPMTSEIVRQLNENFDFIIYDCSPVLSTTDPTILGKLIDGVVMIVKTGVTQRESVEHAINLFGQARVSILGIVLTHLKFYLPRYLVRYNYYQDRYAYYGEERRAAKR